MPLRGRVEHTHTLPVQELNQLYDECPNSMMNACEMQGRRGFGSEHVPLSTHESELPK